VPQALFAILVFTKEIRMKASMDFDVFVFVAGIECGDGIVNLFEMGLGIYNEILLCD